MGRLPARCSMIWDDLCMQGRERVDRQLLDAQALVGHLVPAGSMFAFLAERRGQLFTDEDFADLFPSGRGRPSVPASVMASVMVLQVLHDYSGAEAAEAARCDLRWKAACGFPLDHGGFDPSTLVYWRRRLAASDRPHRVNDAVGRVIEQTGVLRGRRRRAVDSTVLADAVATQDTITQLIAAIRRVGRVVPGAAGCDRGGVHRPRLQLTRQAADRLGRCPGQGCAGLGPGERRERACGRIGRPGAG
jgi:Transposase domain (DUF772)